MSRNYETLFIISPQCQEDDISRVCKTMEDIVTRTGGQVAKLEKWGKKKLAYPVKKNRDGFYVLLQTHGSSQMVNEVERNMRLSDEVIRYLTVRIDDRLKIEQDRGAQEAHLDKTESVPESSDAAPEYPSPDRRAQVREAAGPEEASEEHQEEEQQKQEGESVPFPDANDTDDAG